MESASHQVERIRSSRFGDSKSAHTHDTHFAIHTREYTVHTRFDFLLNFSHSFEVCTSGDELLCCARTHRARALI